jgi:hypothetical protein
MLTAECWVLQFQHRFVSGQKQAVAGAARQELDLRGGLTLVWLEEHRQRQRLRIQRFGVGRSWSDRFSSGGSSFIRSGPARFGGMYRGSKIKRDACGGEHCRRQKRSLHPISYLFSCLLHRL